ncbi:hypothetical protein ACVME5_001209 [Bradyrhizobium liaoningense]
MVGSFCRSEPRGRISRIGENGAAFRLLPLVERQEGLLGHVDLAAHLADVRDVAALQLLRHVFEGADVGGDVLADRAVAARCGSDELAALVTQRHREAIDLRLGGEIDLIVVELQESHDAADEVAHILFGKGVVERQHGNGMPDFLEAARRRRADLLGGRVRGDELGKARLDRVEALTQRVVLGVGDGGRVLLIVALVVPLDLEREPHVLDLGLRLGEVGDVAKRCCFGSCCSGHGAWIRRSGRKGKVSRTLMPRTQRNAPGDAKHRPVRCAAEPGPTARHSGSRLALRASGTRLKPSPP